MIDLHCHLLPGVDDGALDTADSLAMARRGARDGITAICATPHVRHDHDVRIAELPGRLAELRAALRGARIPVQALAGGEVAETVVDGLRDHELRAVTLGGGGRWILLEPRPGPLSDTFAGAIDRLAARGFSVVVAHPERHLGADLVERLRDAIGRGALVQATAALFEPGPAAEGMLALADAGVIHVLGSDAHSSHGGRPVALSAALTRLRGTRVGPHLEWIASTAPRAIVRGEPVTAPYRPRAAA
jgi:protein-tyrosine phosphatase